MPTTTTHGQWGSFLEENPQRHDVIHHQRGTIGRPRTSCLAVGHNGVFNKNGTAEGKQGDRILLCLLIAEISVCMWHAVASISQVVNINGLLRTAKVYGKCYKQDHQVLSASYY